MNVFQALIERRRASSFEKYKINEKYLGLILHAATFAPSAGNLKPWEFVIVEEEETKKKIAELSLKEEKIIQASTLIIVCMDLKKIGLRYPDKKEEYMLEDAGSVITYIMLAAKGLGLDSDWIRVFDKEKISRLLELGDDLIPCGIVLLGKGREFQFEGEIPFENISHKEKYGKKFERGISNLVREIFFSIFRRIKEKIKR